MAARNHWLKYPINISISHNKLLLLTFLLNPNSSQIPNPNSHVSSSSLSSSSSISPSFRSQFHIHRCFCGTLADKTPFSHQNVGFRDMGHVQITRKTTLGRSKLVSQVIDVITSDKGHDYRSKLDSIGTDLDLSMRSVCEVFRVLNCEKVPALQFFEWVRDNNRDLRRKADVCSLMIDNCGCLDDHELMIELMKGFNQENICLTDKAFGFLPIIDSHTARLKKSVESVVDVLYKVGGSSRSSGIIALIKMMCAMGSFEMARHVIELTEKKLSYYAILIREECRRGRFEEAYALLDNARAVGCDPDSTLYNYIIGRLCKSNKISEAHVLLEEMVERSVHPDAITFEIFIYHFCRLGKLDLANQILERLMHMGLVPRFLTHAAIVKSYFSGGHYEEAYKYVHDVKVKNMPMINKIYSLLVRLHQRKGNIDMAQRLLNEMMEGGLKPDYSDFAKTVNVLRHIGNTHSARDLRNKFSKFRNE